MFILVSFGNPLLDISVIIPDNELLVKYKLKPDDQKQIEKDEMKCLYEDVKRLGLKYKYTPGGCAQNTARIFQWLVDKEDSTWMFGAIGIDDQGKELKDIVEHSGVKTKFTEISHEPTGTSIALISGSNRSLVAYLGAAEQLSLINTKYSIDEIVNNGHLFYMEGFFVTKRVELVLKIVETLQIKQKLFAFNISGTYLCESEYRNTIKVLAEKSTILFGNKREFLALKGMCEFEGSFDEFLLHLISENGEQNSPKSGLKYNKIVVVTNGAEPILIGHSSRILQDYVVPKLDQSQIKDTTGAGDAFVAGFIYGFLNNYSPLSSVKLGCEIASAIIKNVGCTTPNCSSYDVLSRFDFNST